MDYQSLIEYDLKNDKKKNGKKDNTKKDASKPEAKRKRSRSRSPKEEKVEPIVEEFINYDIPSRQFGDLFCAVCDSHMNSEQMWENHIKGKRHLKNSRKGDPAEQKYEYSNEEPLAQKELDKETGPIAGLDHICEIIRINQTPVYQCFLCSASLTTSKLLMEHLMGLKHQMAFLKEHDKEKYSLVDSSALSKSYLEPIVQDLILKYEQEHGRGKMSVKKEKGKSGSSYSYKKVIDDDDGPRNKKPIKFPASQKSGRYSPPQFKSSRYSPPPSKQSRYSPPPSKQSRYSPLPSKPSRYSPPPKKSRYSPPPKSTRMKESEWKKVPPVRERSSERHQSGRSYYSDEDDWASVEPDSTYYRREPLHDPHDSRLERSNNYSRAGPPLDDGKNCNDLRVVLEQRKSLGMTSSVAKASMDVPPSAPISSKINTVSDKLLSLVDDLSPEIFLKLTLFKLDNMVVKEEIELKLLDRVADKAAAMALDMKRKALDLDLKAKFTETLAQNGILPEDNSTREMSQFTQNLDNLIGHYKAQKTTVYEDAIAKPSYANQFQSSETLSPQNLNTSSVYRTAPETVSSYDSGWNQRQSSSIPFQSFSSTPTCIPGLTLTEEPPAPSTILSQFAQTAKNIFGNINVPSSPNNPYQNEDCNRLNYRY